MMTVAERTTEQPVALIMAGGTGGHVYPALTVAGALRDNGWEVHWVGTRVGLEARVVPDAGFELHTLPVRGLRGKGTWPFLQGLLRLVAAFVQALSLVGRLRPDVILGMGGYAAGPAGLAGAIRGYPLVIHEQNAVAGTTNRWLAPFAKRVICGFPNAFADKRAVVVAGNPVRQGILDAGAPEPLPVEGFTRERPLRVLVLGGSQGSLPLNRLVPVGLAELVPQFRDQIVVRHQSGDKHLALTRNAYDSIDLVVDVQSFITDMAAAYQWADLVIARSGALTIAELAAVGKPSILIPLPHAIDDHQRRNADYLTACGAAWLLPQSEQLPAALADLLRGVLCQPAILTALSQQALAHSHRDATQRVMAQLMEVSRAT